MLPLMQALDLDKNAELSTEELKKAPASLRGLDKDKDGKLALEELRPAGFPGGRGPGGDRSPAELAANLMAFDTNKDGKLSREELPERLRPIFERADVNKDGMLTREELARAAEARGGRAGSPEAQRPR